MNVGTEKKNTERTILKPILYAITGGAHKDRKHISFIQHDNHPTLPRCNTVQMPSSHTPTKI